MKTAYLILFFLFSFNCFAQDLTEGSEDIIIDKLPNDMLTGIFTASVVPEKEFQPDGDFVVLWDNFEIEDGAWNYNLRWNYASLPDL